MVAWRKIPTAAIYDAFFRGGAAIKLFAIGEGTASIILGAPLHIIRKFTTLKLVIDKSSL
jgi:hypothetical protein